METSKRTIGYERQCQALHMTAKFGYLRPIDMTLIDLELTRERLQQWQRTFMQLERKGMVLKRPNAHATISYVLSGKGARFLRDSGIYINAKSGKDLDLTGPTCFHRTISTLGMLSLMWATKKEEERVFNFFTECEMQRSIAPVTMKGDLTLPGLDEWRLKFVSDGLMHTSDDTYIWIETESRFKTASKLREKLQWLASGFNRENNMLYTTSNIPALRLESVIFIIPTGKDWYAHEARLRREIARLPRGHNEQQWYFLKLDMDESLCPRKVTMDEIRRDTQIYINPLLEAPNTIP